MRLPNADYTRGVKSLGRIGPATAYDAHAREVLVSQTAQDQVLEQLRKSGDAANNWIEARDLSAAELALSNYRQAVADIESNLDRIPAYRATDLPEGVNVKREEVVNGTQQMREVIPAHEVRAQMFDTLERKARTDAFSGSYGKHGQTLRLRVTETGNEAARRQADAAFKGELDAMTGQRNAMIQSAVQAGDIGMAQELIGTGVALGLYTVDQGREMAQKVNTEHETLTFGKQIAAAQTPEQLEEIALQIPQTAKWLSPAQQFALSQTAENHAEVLDNKRTAAYEKSVTEQSAKLRSDATLQIASSGKPLDWDVIATMDLKPSDRTALIAVNKAASETRSQHSDPSTLSEIQSSIFDLSTPNPAPIHLRKQQLQDRVTAELNAGNLSPGDANTLYGRLQSTEGDLFTSEAYKTALDLGYTQIVGGNKSSASFFGGDASNKLRAVEFELELRDAAQAGRDPIEWMRQNVPRFQTAATPAQAAWAVRDNAGTIDKAKTLEKIRSDYTEGRIDATTATKRENDLAIIR